MFCFAVIEHGVERNWLRCISCKYGCGFFVVVLF